MRIWRLLLLALLGSALVLSSCKKKKEDDTGSSGGNNPPSSGEKVLVIDNGAQKVKGSDKNVSYSASFVYPDGRKEPAKNVQWISSDVDVAEVGADGTLQVKGEGAIEIRARVEEGGKVYTTSVPLNIQMEELFAVVPSGIIGMPGDSYELTVVYLRDDNPSFTYQSSDPNVARVSGNGVVELVGKGFCTISVTASTAQERPFVVPVVVVGMPEAPLPIVRIELNKDAVDLFRQETFQFSATAYNANNEPVNTTFTWSSEDPSIVSVDNNGKITAHEVGETYIRVSANGITAKAHVLVQPDTVVVINPFMTSIMPGSSIQFSAKVYKNSRSGLTPLNGVPVQWIVPTFGPGLEMFDIGTIDQNGNFTAKQNALPGMFGFIIGLANGSETAAGGAVVYVTF